ncbi:MAG: hypothetical protein NVS3B21_00850 [Acidimicrobiales bacterium]
MVEFALLIPFLAIIVFGTIDFGRVYQVNEQLKNAAREGAAYARLYPWKQTCPDPDNIAWHATHEGDHLDFVVSASPTSTICTATNPNGPFAPGAGNNIRVTATKPSFFLYTPIARNLVGALNPSATVTVQIP